LRYLVKPCKFENQEEKLLKSQIILGLYSKSTQQKLLRDDPSLDKTVEACKATELAEKNINILNLSDENTGKSHVNQVDKQCTPMFQRYFGNQAEKNNKSIFKSYRLRHVL